MRRCPLTVNRKRLRFTSDDARVIARLFLPGDRRQIQRIVARVAELPADEVDSLLGEILDNFADRHHDIESVLLDHYDDVASHVPDGQELSKQKKLLIGSYFTMEYAVESAALFNPSIVYAPRQDGVASGCARVIMSFRATGEGHVSSLEFRSAVLTADNDLVVDPVRPHLQTPELTHRIHYDKDVFGLQLLEMSVPADPASSGLTRFLHRGEVLSELLNRLPESFTLRQLHKAMAEVRHGGMFDPDSTDATFDRVRWFAGSNYGVSFSGDTEISERVIFPMSENERHGIEDARFVRFEDEGEATYYATYTAYDGETVRTQLLETADFVDFRISTLNGRHANSKGMALFPRKIAGKYAMISRTDGANLYIMFSDDVRFWHSGQKLQRPYEPWELVKIGNCGSPIETEAGWVLLTHGVGPMRRYCLSATLLDRDNPFRVLGRLRQPLLSPQEGEREGYVPNVVYTCGALVHNGELIIPYAMADEVSSVATVGLDELLAALLDSGRRDE